MPVLTTIDGLPLYSTVQEALDYAEANGLTGYHTHIHNGQLGYMAGTTHGQAATSSSGFDQNNTNSNVGNY
tara:strand:- start:73 stop:285 length:213 start_codon:yes stop_codon:yes gene_type:complete